MEEASQLAWVKLYRPDENSGNSGVSYYLKGELVALALDLALRRAGHDLDGVMREAYARWSDGGLPEDGIEQLVAARLGADAARALFDATVRGHGLPPLDLALVGLRLRRRVAQGADDKGGTPGKPEERRAGWLGAEFGAGLTVKSVREGSPAWRAGLTADDELLAEGGFRLDAKGLQQRLEEQGPEGTLRLTLFRRDELLEVEVPLAEPPEDTLWLEPLPDADAGAAGGLPGLVRGGVAGRPGGRLGTERHEPWTRPSSPSAVPASSRSWSGAAAACCCCRRPARRLRNSTQRVPVPAGLRLPLPDRAGGAGLLRAAGGPPRRAQVPALRAAARQGEGDLERAAAGRGGGQGGAAAPTWPSPWVTWRPSCRAGSTARRRSGSGSGPTRPGTGGWSAW